MKSNQVICVALLAALAGAAIAGPALAGDEGSPECERRARSHAGAKGEKGKKGEKPAPETKTSADRDDSEREAKGKVDPEVEGDAEDLGEVDDAEAAERPSGGRGTSKSAGEPDTGTQDAKSNADLKGSAAGLLGYATGGGNFGLGARGGYKVVDQLVVGGALVYQFGESVDAGNVKTSASYFYVGPEAGYDLFVGPVTVRPYLGLGLAVARVSQEIQGQSESNSSSSLALWPGAMATYDIPKSPAFVGLDTRLVVLTEGGDPSFAASITGGARF